jgi:Ser/Thr protein kinase RdoA (MazF antagonist)
VLVAGPHLFELFRWVEGQRCSGSEAAVANAGAQLAHLHRLAPPAADFSAIPAGGFHDAEPVRRHLEQLGQSAAPRCATAWQSACARLLESYHRAGLRVDRQGFAAWPLCINHGDWHPGNLLFREAALAAVLDFDALQVAPAAADAANGLLQFSLVAGDPRPEYWPAHCEHRRLIHFWDGYCRISQLPRESVAVIPDLMVETLIAETVLPVAATGIFDQPHGLDFLLMIRRKVEWLEAHRSLLIESLDAVVRACRDKMIKAPS